ncbi:prepronociceptin [Engraulis encrasicolus]|uniref:prepronociceptin n=1 Tax=Engraulis encrasicolus TaxID=184585 RepID=UPI002FCEB54B
MKSPLWMLVFVCVFVPGHGDCPGDCLTCLDILPRDQAFNTLVCLVQCHGNISPGHSWDACRRAMDKPLYSHSHSTGGAAVGEMQVDVPALLPLEQAGEAAGGGLLYSAGALQRFDHVARALGLGLGEQQLGGPLGASRGTRLSSRSDTGLGEEAQQADEEEDEVAQQQAINLTKRFGGFLKGKYGYKKLVNPSQGRSYQKRYGGFIGVRKSARKWNNQKRFTEFLKQYLGMSTRAAEYKSVSTDLNQQNEV